MKKRFKKIASLALLGMALTSIPVSAMEYEMNPNAKGIYYENGYKITTNVWKSYNTGSTLFKTNSSCKVAHESTGKGKRHYTRARSIKSITGGVVSDSGQIFTNGNSISAITPGYVENNLNFASRGYWGW